MLKKITLPLIRNIKIIALIFFFIITILISLYLNHEKNLSVRKYNNFINNVYFQKTLNKIINNLEPRYKIYNHIYYHILYYILSYIILHFHL